MNYSDNYKLKTVIVIASFILTAVVTLLFFLDTSLVWNGYKIASCFVVDIRVFFVIPSLRLAFFKLKDMSIEDSFKAGLRVGISGIFLPLLIAPYYGAKYYLTTKKDDEDKPFD